MRNRHAIVEAKLSFKLVQISSKFIDVALTINTFAYHVALCVEIDESFSPFTVITEEPEFTETIENVTVPAGELKL